MEFFAKNIRHIRSLKGLSQEQFADDLKVTRSRISSYEEGRVTPPIYFLIALSEYFNLPIDILVKNDLTKSNQESFIEVGNKRVLFPITIDGANDDLIEVIPIEASAGYLNGYADPEYIEHLEKIKLPFLPPGKHRAFPIKGDSMLPIKSGSFIVARFVENIRDIKSGDTYIVLSQNDGMVYKRVFRTKENPDSLLMVSDNKKYSSYNLPIDDVLEVWEYACSINTAKYNEQELKLSNIVSILTNLGTELKTIEASIKDVLETN